MNRSKIIGATALASVMTAGAAILKCLLMVTAGTLTDNDGGGLASTFSTNSIYVSYSDSMDNGMGVGLTMSVTAAGIKTSIDLTLVWVQLVWVLAKMLLLTKTTRTQLVSHL